MGWTKKMERSQNTRKILILWRRLMFALKPRLNLKMASFIFVLAFSLVGCDGLFKKSKPKKQLSFQKIILPNGKKVRVSESAKVSGQGANVNTWQDGVKKRARQCVESICQLPESFLYELEDEYYFLTANEKSKLHSSERVFESEIWPKLDQRISADYANNEKTLQEISDLVERVPTDRAIKVDSFTKVLIKYVFAMDRLKDYKWDTHYDQEEFAATQRLALKQNIFNKLSPSEQEEVEEALILYHRTIKGDTFNSNLSMIENTGLRYFLLYNYDSSSIEKSNKLFRQEIQQKFDLIKQTSPLLYKLLIKNISLKKVLDGEKLLPVEEKKLSDDLFFLSLYTGFITNPWPEFEQMEFNFDEFLKGSEIIKQLRQYEVENSDERRAQKHRVSREKTHGICRQGISAYLASRPSQDQIVFTNDLILKIKTASKTVAKGMFPSATKADIDSLISGIRFILPVASSNATANLFSEIEVLSEISIESVLDNFDELGEEEIENFLGLFITTIKMKVDKDDGEYSHISDLCLNYLPKTLSDASVTVDNAIFTSGTTIKAGESGAGIIAHEVAHRLYRDLNGSPNSSLQSCLKNRHFESFINDGGVNKEKYLSEDFADHFSSQVLKHMGLTSPQHNLACLFFNNIKFEKENVDVPFYLSSTKHPLITTDDDDEHSSDTFRLLQVSSDLGHLTPACQIYAQNESGKTYPEADGSSMVTPMVRQCTAE